MTHEEIVANLRFIISDIESYVSDDGEIATLCEEARKEINRLTTYRAQVLAEGFNEGIQAAKDLLESNYPTN